VSDAAALYLPEVSRWHGDSHVTAFCERMLALRGAIGEIVRLEIGREELYDVRSWTWC
jgi:hypothetical protein